MVKTNLIILLLVFTLTMLSSACYAPVIEGAQQGYDATKRVMLKHDATPVDPAEQFKLGNTYCCKGGGPLNDMSIYDNSKATYWYCKSARQGYGPAQLQLARLYSGHAIRGVHVILRTSALVGTAETDFSSALMWAELTANNVGEGDVDDAIELRSKLTNKVTDKERERTVSLMENWQTAACQWNEVMLTHNDREK